MQIIRYLHSKILGSHEPEVVLVLNDLEFDSVKKLGVEYTLEADKTDNHRIIVKKEDFIKKLSAA